MSRRVLRIHGLAVGAALSLAACSSLLPGPPPSDVPIYLVRQPMPFTEGPVIVRVGLGDPSNRSDPGELVAWVAVEEGTFQTVMVPLHSHPMISVVQVPACRVDMEQPGISWGDDRDTDPANRPFHLQGVNGRRDQSAWGLPIGPPFEPMPPDVHEVPLNEIDNPCPAGLE